MKNYPLKESDIIWQTHYLKKRCYTLQNEISIHYKLKQGQPDVLHGESLHTEPH